MSNVQSTDLKSLNEIITNVCVSVTTNTSNVQKVNCMNSNQIDATGIKIRNCDVLARQDIGSICQLQASAGEQTSAALSNDIANKLIATLNGKQESVQGFLAAASNVQLNTQSIQNIIRTTVSNTISSNSFNECGLNAFNKNTQSWKFADIDCGGRNFVMDQSIMNNAVGKCLSQKLVDALLQNKQINDAVNDMKSDQSSKQAGIAELVGAWGMIIIGVVFFIVVIIVGVLVYLNYNPEIAKELTGKIPTGPGAAFM